MIKKKVHSDGLRLDVTWLRRRLTWQVIETEMCWVELIHSPLSWYNLPLTPPQSVMSLSSPIVRHDKTPFLCVWTHFPSFPFFLLYLVLPPHLCSPSHWLIKLHSVRQGGEIIKTPSSRRARKVRRKLILVTLQKRKPGSFDKNQKPTYFCVINEPLIYANGCLLFNCVLCKVTIFSCCCCCCCSSRATLWAMWGESDSMVINGNIHPLTSTAETAVARSSQLDASQTILWKVRVSFMSTSWSYWVLIPAATGFLLRTEFSFHSGCPGLPLVATSVTGYWLMIGGEGQRKTRVSGANRVVKWPDGSVGRMPTRNQKVLRQTFFFSSSKLWHSTAVDHQNIPVLSFQWMRSLFSLRSACSSCRFQQLKLLSETEAVRLARNPDKMERHRGDTSSVLADKYQKVFVSGSSQFVVSHLPWSPVVRSNRDTVKTRELTFFGNISRFVSFSFTILL